MRLSGSRAMAARYSRAASSCLPRSSAIHARARAPRNSLRFAISCACARALGETELLHETRPHRELPVRATQPHTMLRDRWLERHRLLQMLNGVLESGLVERDAPEVQVSSRIVRIAGCSCLEGAASIRITVRLERRNGGVPIL